MVKVLKYLVFVILIGFCVSESTISPDEGKPGEEKTTMSTRQMIDAMMDDTGNDTSASATPVKDPAPSSRKRSGIISKNPDDIEFYLYADKYDSANSAKISLSDPLSVEKSDYNPLRPLIMIIHGFSENYTSDFPQSTKEEYINENIKSNIIIVDWGKLSTPIGGVFNFMLYPLAANNVIIVGKRIAEFIKFLISVEVLPGPEKVHMVGYDLGAHVAGVAANRMLRGVSEGASMNPVGRITGLDPSGPMFDIMLSQDNKLDSTDASFVDVIHTSQGIIGFWGALGHADFYPNGGGPLQPGCSEIVNANGWCAHRKAYLYFIKSISDKSIKGCQCSSYIDVVCKNQCKNSATFGEFCPSNARGKFYFDIKVEDTGTGNMEMQMKMMSMLAPK